MNPNSDEAILQQLYGPDEHHAHIEAWHLKRSMDRSDYVSHYTKKWQGRFHENAPDNHWRVVGHTPEGKPIFGEKQW